MQENMTTWIMHHLCRSFVAISVILLTNEESGQRKVWHLLRRSMRLSLKLLPRITSMSMRLFRNSFVVHHDFGAKSTSWPFLVSVKQTMQV